jgi:uncharacterized protein
MPTDVSLEWVYLALCASAFLAGVMNSIAGGGTLLTFPALTQVVTFAVANATSTVALLPGSLAGAWGYRKELAHVRGFALRLLPVSIAGGWLGSELVSRYPDQFGKLVPWLILTAAVLFLIQPVVSKMLKRKSGEPAAEPGVRTSVGVMVFQFLIATYGGYFGAGIGILMLTALGFMGVGDIHRMNAVKTFLAAAINGVSVLVFIRDGLVNWPYAGAMAVAAVVGGYAGARVARRLPAVYVRWAVVIIALTLVVHYAVSQKPSQ